MKDIQFRNTDQTWESMVVPVANGGTGTTTLTGNTGLIQKMFNNNDTSAIYVPTFNSQWEDGSYRSIKEMVLNTAYPVGSVYFSFSNTSPATFLGGSWAQLTSGKFIRIDTNTNAGNASSHSHGLTSGYAMLSGTSAGEIQMQYKKVTAWKENWVEIANSGRGGNLNVDYGISLGGTTDAKTADIPPYQNVYAWRRTA